MEGAAQWTPTLERIIAQGLYGLVVGMAVFIFALFREWVVLGTHYRAVVKDKDEYKALIRTAEDSATETRKILAELAQKLERRS